MQVHFQQDGAVLLLANCDNNVVYRLDGQTSVFLLKQLPRDPVLIQRLRWTRSLLMQKVLHPLCSSVAH